MTLLTPFPKIDAVYSVTLVNVTDFYGANATIISYTISGTIPPGLAMSITNSNTLTLSGTATTFGAYFFGYTLTVARPGLSNRTMSDNYETHVIYQPLPASGPIKWSDIGARCGIVGAVSASDSKFKELANNAVTTPVSISTTRSKPVAGTITQGAGSTPWTIPVYQTMIVRVAGAGGGGGSGANGYFNTFTGFCQYNDFGYNGTNGSQSSAFDIIAYGGLGGTNGGAAGNPGTNNKDSNTGGGSAGGAGITRGSGGCGSTGGKGGDGGFYEITYTNGVNGPAWLSTTTLTGGTAGYNTDTNSGYGTDGVVTIEWA